MIKNIHLKIINKNHENKQFSFEQAYSHKTPNTKKDFSNVKNVLKLNETIRGIKKTSE